MSELNGHIKNGLPKDWKWVKLGQICEIRSGKNQSKVSSQNGKYPIYGSSGIFGYADDYICDEGTTIIGRKGTINNPIYVQTKFWNVDTAFGIKPNKSLNSRLFYYFCKGFNFHKLDKSTTIPSLAKTDLLNIDVPLPPDYIQQDLLSKIEELFSEIDKGVEELKAAQAQLKIYRQAVLKWAFEGKLTNENVKDGELPEGWKDESLGNLSNMCLGKMLDKQKNKGDFKPYLRNINVRWGTFDLSNLEQMKFEDSEQERYSLKQGDLVICEGGEPGRCAIWNQENEFIMIQKALHRVRVFDSLNVKYLYYFMFYSAIKGTLEKYFTGTTIKHLTGKELKKIKLPFPSLEEQQQIVQEIESRFSVCDKTEETITNSLQQAAALRQSILKKAFEGKLIYKDN